MTTYTQEHIEKAYELGRMHERHKMADLASITGAPILQSGMTVSGPGDYRGVVVADANGARKRPGRAFKKVGTAHKVTNEPKAPTKAHGAREKGVKERIVSMIATAPLTVAEIIAHTGFKATSVRATLMSLKKAGLAMQGNDGWMTGAPHGGGNSEGEAAAL